MLPTTIRTPPSVAGYVPLAEYQSQTPESFVDSKPVLHYHVQGGKAWVPRSQSNSLALFPADSSVAPSGPEGEAINDNPEDLIEQKVDILVTSETFIIFSPQAEAGVSIPYPSISIHAVKQIGPEGGARIQTVWMQLEFSDGGAGDDDFNIIELTVIPPPNDATPSAAAELYEALSRCSDLHPDPNNEDDEEDFDGIVFEGSAEYEQLEGFPGVMRGGADSDLPPPMPGSGGWITAENVHEYFDEDGNWLGRGDEELGEGAGRVRARDEVEEAVNGHGSTDDSESKRPRVD